MTREAIEATQRMKRAAILKQMLVDVYRLINALYDLAELDKENRQLQDLVHHSCLALYDVLGPVRRMLYDLSMETEKCPTSQSTDGVTTSDVLSTESEKPQP